ncbi:nuclear migration protein JNM1 [Microdochium nivale]|nr:nuclear migration protein JNM1 [Microdochium nivale]
MALNRKYAALPDLDSAPDIYETPDLTDDNSTAPTTAGPPRSDGEFDEDDEEDDDEYSEGISHTRLRIDQARSKFLPSQVDARGVDFSDRVAGKRKSYRTSSRRQRAQHQDDTDYSENEEDESLERKIARLRREIEEAKEEYGRQHADDDDGDEDDEEAEHFDDELRSLSQALEDMSMPTNTAIARGEKRPQRQPAATDPQTENMISQHSDGVATYSVTYMPSYEESHALAKAADFDRRLVMLEKAIGVSTAAGSDSSGLTRAIMPTIDMLSKQITTLSEASTTSLDSMSRRVRTLAQEAEQLEKSRRAARAAQEAAGAPGTAPEDTEESEQTAKVNALYGTLPTIENLAPLLPALLDRLRSLRSIHADAATASETLERIEKSQNETAKEIAQWRDGLERVEEAIEEGETAMSGNMKTIESWVEDLESKLAELS